VCVLRERGLNEEAERLRAGELMTLLAAVRAPGESDAIVTDRLNALFATESERVANAAVLAEMLVPLMADQLRSLASPTATAPAAQSPQPLPQAPAPLPTRPAGPRPVSIADFIDEMIAQENPPEPPRDGTHRRAS
jgi:hypothetical protein